MSELDLEAIKVRWSEARSAIGWNNQLNKVFDTFNDIPALIAEVERLRATVAGYRLDMATLVAEVERLRAELVDWRGEALCTPLPVTEAEEATNGPRTD